MIDQGFRELVGLNIRYAAHMGKHERRVWDAFCETLDEAPSAIYYDICLGTAENKWLDKKYQRRSHRDPWASWRADALLVYDDIIRLVEVKHHANVQAVGQLVSYPLLFEESYKVEIPVAPLLVAAYVPLPLRFVLDHYKIDYVELRQAHDYGVGPKLPDLFVKDDEEKGNGK